VRMVTGQGKAITVSATENSDLFWGIKGAGVNFGIVLESTFRIYNASNAGYAMNADFRYEGKYNESVWEVMRAHQDNQAVGLSFDVAVGYDPRYNGTFVSVNAIFAGPLAAGRDKIKALEAIPNIGKNISEIPWKSIEGESRFGVDVYGCAKGRYHSVYGNNLYTIDVATLVAVTNYLDASYKKYVELQNSIFAYVQYGKTVMKSVPDDSAAYAYRNATAYVHFDVSYPGPNSTAEAEANEVGSTTRDMLYETDGSNTKDVFVNFAHGDEGAKSWYSERKLKKLEILKQIYDPERVFTNFNPI